MVNSLKKNLRSRCLRPLPLILLASVLLRVGAALYLGQAVSDLPGIADQVSYHALALRLVEGHGFTFDRVWWPVTAAGAPTAHWSYLYTLFLAGVYSLIGATPLAARLLQAVAVGLLHPWLAFLLGKRLFGERAGLIAAGITALYVYFIYYAAALMTEGFYISAILGALVLALRLAEGEGDRVRTALGLGLCLAGAALLRQVILLFAPFLFLWLLLVLRRKAVLPLGLAGLVVAASIAPVTWFNYRQFDRFVLLNTNAGYAFFWGNHPVYGTHFVPILPGRGAYQKLIPAELRGLDEAALDNELLRRGIAFVVDDPVRYALLSLSRIPAYFQFWPSAKSGLLSNISRTGSFGLFLPFMLWGLWRGFPRRWDGPGALLLLFAVVYTGVHLLTWALVRYRLPVDAVLIPYAALPFDRLWVRWRTRP